MALEKQKVEKYKAEVQDYGERLGKEVQKMPMICPTLFGLKNIDNCDKGCVECWNQSIPAEGGEE